MEIKPIMERLKMDKKGVLGLNTVQAFMATILILAVLAFAIIVAVANLNDTNVLTAGSQEANDSTNVLRNVSGGVADFFSNTATFFSILAAVVIILAVVLIIVAVQRFNTGGSGSL